jgi:hypothetical protein
VDRLLALAGPDAARGYAAVIRVRRVTGAAAERTLEGLASRFLRETGTSAARLNQAGRLQAQQDSLHAGVVKELVLLRELADMIYQLPDAAKRAAAAEDAVQRLGIDFSQDHQAALRLRLAPLSRPERARTLVDELSRVNGFNPENDDKLSLTTEEGLAAGEAAGAKLREMEARHEGHPAYGFRALFELIGRVGDTRQLALVGRFLQDADPAVAEQALSTYEWLLARERKDMSSAAAPAAGRD